MSLACIFRLFPVLVTQTLQDSCWAAVLESWPRVDSRFNHHLSQAVLIRAYGEGDTGGITPASKIPMIAASLNLNWTTCGGSGLVDYLRQHLAASYIFCGYSVRQFIHSVLIYYYDEEPSGPIVQFMDSDGGRLVRRPVDWVESHAPLVLMRKR
jgi:hypothetical protein